MSIPVEKIIDLQELRIGNYLYYDGKIVHVTMLSCDIDDEYEETIGFCLLGETTHEKGGWNRSLANKLERIILTPELLTKAGFEKDRNGWNYPNTFFSLTDQFYPCWLDRMLWPQDVKIFKDRSLKYLHELQNLFFALTGEELKFKP